MDVVYILGSGSLADNKEIFYSIRSLEKNMLDLGDIYIVGEFPPFLPRCKHIPARDIFKDKWQNALSKVRLACSVGEISEEFLLMNDDFFILEPFSGAEWPFYALKGSNGGSCGQHSFHIHCPIRINKEFYLKMPLDTESKACKSPRTFYSNFYKAPPKFSEDFILRVGPVCRDFDDQIKNWPSFSISADAVLNDKFISWLEKMYPEPSRFESKPLA